MCAAYSPLHGPAAAEAVSIYPDVIEVNLLEYDVVSTVGIGTDGRHLLEKYHLYKSEYIGFSPSSSSFVSQCY